MLWFDLSVSKNGLAESKVQNTSVGQPTAEKAI